jgi:hypothetical protein
MPKRLALASCLAAALAACAPQQAAAPQPAAITPAQYAAMQRLAGRSIRARAQLATACVARKLPATPEEQAVLAAALEVDAADLHRAYCERLVAAIGRGEVSYDDYVALESDRPDPQVWHRLLPVLKPVPGEIQI